MSSTKMAIFFASASFLLGAFAQEQQNIRVNNAPLNIEGYVEEVEETVADKELDFINSEIKKQQKEIKLNKAKAKGFKKLQKSTEKLSETTEEYIEEKMEAQEEIDKYNKKIDCLLKDASAPGCEKYVKNAPVAQEVSTQQAAPQEPAVQEQKIETPVEVIEVEEETQDLRVIPVLGAKSFNSSELSLETNFAGGVKIEGEVTERLNMGAAIQFVRMDSQFITNELLGGSYQTVYSSGRELRYDSTSIDFYARYALNSGKRLTPYVGAGLSYNRSKLQFEDNNPDAVIGEEVYSGESYINHFVATALFLGTDVAIDEEIGINVQLDYIRGLGNSLTNEAAQNPLSNADQQTLIDISNEIADSDIFALSIGLIVAF